MMPYMVHRAAGRKLTGTPVYFNGREYRRMHYSTGRTVVFAVIAHKGLGSFKATRV
jgi:hypothetical protein